MNNLGRAASLTCAGMAVACAWWGLTVAQTPPGSTPAKAANDQSAQPATKSNPEVRASKSIEILPAGRTTKTPPGGGALVCRDGPAPLSPIIRLSSPVWTGASYFGVSALVAFAALPFNSITITSNA